MITLVCNSVQFNFTVLQTEVHLLHQRVTNYNNFIGVLQMYINFIKEYQIAMITKEHYRCTFTSLKINILVSQLLQWSITGVQ